MADETPTAIITAIPGKPTFASCSRCPGDVIEWGKREEHAAGPHDLDTAEAVEHALFVGTGNAAAIGDLTARLKRLEQASPPAVAPPPVEPPPPPPPGPAPLPPGTAFSFTGVDNAPWHPTWYLAGTAPGVNDIQGNQGRIRLEAASGYTFRLAAQPPVTPANVDIVMTFRYPTDAGEKYLSLEARGANGSSVAAEVTQNSYRLYDNGTLIGTNVATTAHRDGALWKLRLRLDGTTASIRMWAAAATEPTTWDRSGTVVTNQPGGVIINAIAGAAATTCEFFIDQLDITPIVASSGNPATPAFAVNVTPPANRPVDRRVVLHMMTSMPLSLDNGNPASDYWETGYFPQNGEGGIWNFCGGLCRDRPWPVPGPRPLAGDWRLADGLTEVLSALNDGGVDTLALNIMVMPPTANWQPDVTNAYCRAAAQIARPNTIILELDVSNASTSAWQNTLTPAAIATWCKTQIDAAGVAYWRRNGRYVFSGFGVQAKPPSWWSALWTQFKNAYGMEIDFIPVFHDVETSSPAYISDPGCKVVAVSEWGDRSQAANPTSPTGYRRQRIDNAHARGVGFMPAISLQDNRPKEGLFDEANNTGNLRSTFQIAIEGATDPRDIAAHVITANDYAEVSSFAGSRYHGLTFYNLLAMYSEWWRNKVQPPIAREAIWLTHRRQPHAALATGGQTLYMKPRPGTSPPRDKTEALVALMAPATVEILDDGVVIPAATVNNAGPGLVPVLADLAIGVPSARIVRSGSPVLTVTSPHAVAAQLSRQDLQYVGNYAIGVGTDPAPPPPPEADPKLNLADTFATNDLTTRWHNLGDAAVVTNDLLRVNLSTTESGREAQTAESLVGKRCHVRFKTVPNTQPSDPRSTMNFHCQQLHDATYDRLAWSWYDGTCYAEEVVNGASTVTSFAYNSTDHQHFSVRVSADGLTVYWETAPDNGSGFPGTWTVKRTKTLAALATNVKTFLTARRLGTTVNPAGVAEFDNLNTAA